MSSSTERGESGRMRGPAVAVDSAERERTTQGRKPLEHEEEVFEAYVIHRSDVIFLAGLPNRSES